MQNIVGWEVINKQAERKRGIDIGESNLEKTLRLGILTALHRLPSWNCKSVVRL